VVAAERELWFTGPRRVELRQGEPLPPLAPGEVKARALHSGISQGTELLLYRGEGPRVFDPSLDKAGTPVYPRRYGYSWVGEIVESRAQGAEVGQHVFALRSHGDVHVLRPEVMRVIPASIPSARATLAANLETALTVVWDAGTAVGDRVLVLGGGVVGLLSTMLAKVAGAAWVSLVEPLPGRRQAALALRWIVDFADARKGTPMREALAAEIMEAYQGQGNAIRKRDEVHKMAQANKAFAHFRW